MQRKYKYEYVYKKSKKQLSWLVTPWQVFILKHLIAVGCTKTSSIFQNACKNMVAIAHNLNSIAEYPYIIVKECLYNNRWEKTLVYRDTEQTKRSE